MYANWGFARIRGTGWGWAGVIWLYSLVTYIPLDILKFIIRYALSGRAWDNVIENKVRTRTLVVLLGCTVSNFVPFVQTAFTSKKDYGKGEREAQWAQAQRTLHGLQPAQPSDMFNDKSTYRELSEIADQAKRRAEVAR